MSAAKFRVGDSVRVISRTCRWDDQTGTVASVNEDQANPYEIAGLEWHPIWFREDELTLADPQRREVAQDGAEGARRVEVTGEANEAATAPLAGRCKLGGHEVTLDEGMWRHRSAYDSLQCASLRLAALRTARQ